MFSNAQQQLLVVEDNPTDRELVRYLLEARFKEVQVLEAATLQAAVAIMSREDVECVILDLQLPDSTGTATFTELYGRFPNVPFVVMTHNRDRQLALEMIQLGAADFVIKNFTDEEELFHRIVFAIEKHKHSVRVQREDAATFQRLDRAQANLKTAHQSGQHQAIRDTTVEATAAIADLSRRMFAEMQALSIQVTQMTTAHTTVVKTVDELDKHILRGEQGRPSMRSQVDLMDHRLTAVEKQMKETEAKETKLSETKSSNRTTIILAIIGVISTLVAGLLGINKATGEKPEKTPAAATATAGEKK